MKFETVRPYVDRGFACQWLTGKKPFQREWSTLPVATLEDLRKAYFPLYNLGVRVGKWSTLEAGYGLVVLDVDLRDPLEGDRCYEAVEGLLGHSQLNVASGRGLGGHIYLKCPLEKLPAKAATTVAIGEGWKLELLSTGKNLVVPPSVHPDTKKRYEWVNEEIGFVPEALLSAEDVSSNPSATERILLSAGAKGRYITLRDKACALQGKGFSDAYIWTGLVRQNGKFEEPLPEWEMKRAYEFALSKPKGKGKTND